MKRKQWMSYGMGLLIVWWIVCALLVVGLPGCAAGTLDTDEEGSVNSQRCLVDSARYPTTAMDFAGLYAGRSFLVDDVHLGRDVLLTEGTAIHPIACGVVRIYRPASGYGTLVVVIEHTLPEPMVVRTGSGASFTIRQFVSIYGHLRTTMARAGGHGLSWPVGSAVTPQDTIGYVQNGALNGDGGEHLHFGIRVQSARDAELVDTSWFRGYDTEPSQRRWFTDPATFMPNLFAFLQAERGVDASVPLDVGLDMPRPTMSAMDAGVDASRSTPVSDVPQTTPMSVHDAGVPPSPMSLAAGIRYEFRIRADAGWNAQSPFRLRDQWWTSQVCRNTGRVDLELQADGWMRCDLATRVTPFDGSFFTSLHPDWGDAGQLGTIANTPERCSPVRGAEWRLTDLASGRRLYEGPVSGLRCVAVGSQDRLVLPE